MRYVSLDLETTGLDPKCAVLEVAVVLEDTQAHPLPRVEDLPHYRVVIQPTQMFMAQVVALQMNRDLLETAQASGVPEELAWTALEDVLRGWGISAANRGVLAGKNVSGFDRKFLPPQINRLFHHRCVDPGSVLIDWSRDLVPGMRDLLGEDAKHTALEDARDVVRLLRRSYA